MDRSSPQPPQKPQRPTTPPSTQRRAASPPQSAPRSASTTKPERRFRLSTGFLVFIGSLLGSLIGVAADFGQAADTFERVQSLFYPELCIVGSNTILGDGIMMATDWGAEFQERQDVRVTVRGVGSVRGVEQAVNGDCVHILAMSEPMTERQYQLLRDAGITLECAAEIGYDVIAFVSDIQNRTSAILERNLSSILMGRIKNWAQIGNGAPQAIRIFARPGSGTTEYVLLNAAQYSDPDITDNEYFPPDSNYESCSSNTECLDQTLATPGSLYWVSTAWMRTQPERYLRVIPILRGDEAAINPLGDNVNLDEYPNSLIRPLYLYVLSSAGLDDRSEQVARDFLQYVRSVHGQEVLESYHFYTFFDQPNDVDVIMPPGFERLPDGSRPVCLNHV